MALAEPERVTADDITVVELTEDDLREMYEDALARAGLTEDELRAKAREGDLGPPTVFWAWMLLDDFIDPLRGHHGAR